MFRTNCNSAIELANAKLPEINQLIKKVEPVPVMRQLTAFTRLREAVSLIIYSLNE